MDQMVDKAVALFARKGFALSTRELAQGLGVTQPLLYRYFPGKQALIDAVYDKVFMSRWKPEWETQLRDRSVPLESRLIDYFVDYSDAILRSEWVRIFLFAGLQDPTLNQRYLAMLHQRIFDVINDELRYECGVRRRPGGARLALEREVLWGFHSSFFYLGVRKWVYEMPVPDDVRPIIVARVRAFLHGVLAMHTR
ncbi:TetR/AcrR family transcriptional regulator [uncultured Pseudacidovorax sp.]|uniref:TetR/AcrR family transcriptional regulator n=1 Tax=uncultured Pseudacidovorax sp. TaxID=679313 RepID=UPI0025EEB956|nr:TetR/AcrR family transcriptional regulator [uncultured Pseudacidovorax sp.]